VRSELIEYRHWKLGLLWLLITGIVMIRIPLYWSAGEFVAEDAWVFFADAFNHSWTSSILTPYAGYFLLLTRIIAELLSILPVSTQAYGYAFSGIFLNALFFSIFYLPHFRRMLPHDGARATVVVILALAQNSENLGFLLGLHWYLAFLLPLLMVMEFPKGKPGRVTLYASSILCAWSSPSNLVVLPFLLWQLITEKADKAKQKWKRFTLINLVVVAVFIVLLRFRDAARTGEIVFSQIPHALDRLVLRGWMGTGILGQSFAEALVNFQPWLLDLFGLLILCLLAKLLYHFRNGVVGQSSLVLLGSAFLMLGLSMTRSLYIGELSEISLPRHVRYLTGPTLLLNVCALIFLWQVLKHKHSAWFFIACGIQGLLLISGLPKATHWSRSPETFKISNYAEAIEMFENEYLNTGKRGVLYIPSDVPYWGPLLISGDGPVPDSQLNLVEAVSSSTIARKEFNTWITQFQQGTDTNRVEHPTLGPLHYDGLAEGRVWFRDSQNRLLFTSELLYPHLWSMDGMNFKLIRLD
jgi:hypothetical protein